MSPIEYIEEGICNGSWETVCKGYERLTGKSLPLPIEHFRKTNQAYEALRQIISIAAGVFPKSEPIIVDSKPPKKKSRGRPKKKSTMTNEEDTTLILDSQINTPVTQKTSGTQLITNKPDPEEVKKNKIKAIKAQPNKLKFNRSPVRTFDVKCNECEEVFQSDRPDGELGQKCSKCLREKKNRLT